MLSNVKNTVRNTLRNTFKNIVKNTLLVTLVTINVFYVGCDNKEEQTTLFDSTFTNSADSPDQIFRHFEVFFYDSSSKKARLTAKSAKMFFKSKRTLVDTNVYCEFYDTKTNKISTILQSDSAIIEDDTKNMYAYGNVKVSSDSSKTKLTSQELKWDNQKQILISNKYVKIDSPYEIIEGYGFESNLNLTNYKIYRVSGQIIK